MPPLDLSSMIPVTLTLGALLVTALLAGVFGQFIRLPKVTSYLLMGMVIGSMGWIPQEHIGRIEPLTKLAIALVLFNLGCHFPLGRVRRIIRRVVRLSFGELGMTFLLTVTILPLLGARWDAALLLGVLALATAPATTILVLKETESEGPLTEYTNALVAMNNLVSIVLFELLFLAIIFMHGRLPHPLLTEIGLLARHLIGSLLLGVAAGLVVSYCFGLVAENRRLVLLVGIITLVLGICLQTETPYLLTFLAMGATVANSSYQARQMLAELDRLTGLLTVVFFVTHGAELQVDKLWMAGSIGAGYIVLRLYGKYFGIWMAARSGGEEPAVRNWLGTALMAQAGAAIALTHIAAGRAEQLQLHEPLLEMFVQVQTVILGTVVVFEIAGPLLIRQAVLRAAEMPLAHAVRHPGPSPLEQLRTVCNGVLMAFGFSPWGNRSEAGLAVSDIMRRNVPKIAHSAIFDDVITCIEHSRDNTFPVVDSAGELVGVIRYRELSHALFDRQLGALVRAADVTTPAGRVLYPDEPISRASGLFAASKDDCIPVVAGEQPRQFLGVVRRRDVLRLLIRDRTEA